ncbi:hypothetical protein AVEN_167144-1, partial [Araneus ventricosus]
PSNARFLRESLRFPSQSRSNKQADDEQIIQQSVRVGPAARKRSFDTSSRDSGSSNGFLTRENESHLMNPRSVPLKMVAGKGQIPCRTNSLEEEEIGSGFFFTCYKVP